MSDKGLDIPEYATAAVYYVSVYRNIQDGMSWLILHSNY